MKIKKTLALLLALVMMLSVSLVACTNDNNNNNNFDDEDDDDGFVNIGGNNTQTENTDTDTGNVGGWENVSVTIYVLGNGLNIRDAADSTESNILGKAKIGDSFVATAADDDWYKITYEGKEAYVSADYVTINPAEATFEECTPEVLKIKNTVVNESATKDTEKYVAVNLRTDPVVIDKTVTTNVLTFKDTTGDQLVKVGANKAGTWYKVTYNSETYYIASGAFKYFEGYTDNNAGGLG